MAANGNEAVKLSQLKDMYKVASDTSYGVVKLVSDDVLMNLMSGSDIPDGTYAITVSQLKMLVDSSGGSGGGVEEEEILWSGYYNNVGEGFDINKNINLYSKIIVTFQNNSTDYVIVPDTTGAINVSSVNDNFYLQRIGSYTNYFIIIPQTTMGMTKVVGIKR